ncbi:MAG: hypothetical protein HDT44_06305 [Ruminococcaceae bacterium]|nr:hypothetical protein [Oscillospiraceae bacterium]
MVTGHSDKLPKNRFGELDELEKRERLDMGERKDRNAKNSLNLPIETAFPITAYPNDAKFVYPFVSTGFTGPSIPAWHGEDTDIERYR